MQHKSWKAYLILEGLAAWSVLFWRTQPFQYVNGLQLHHIVDHCDPTCSEAHTCTPHAHTHMQTYYKLHIWPLSR